MCIPLGQNLHETLCYNLVPYPNREVMRGDSALWERGPKKLPLKKPKQKASGYADLFTWQPRMVLLEDLPSGKVMAMRFVAGQGFDNTSNITDPMQPYETNKTKGKMPMPFREERGTWRDFDSLLPGEDDRAPLTIQNALRLAGRNAELMPRSILVLGLSYEPPNANVDFWRMERFSLPIALASDRNIKTEIEQLLTEAAETETALEMALRTAAKLSIAKGDRELQADKWSAGRWMPGDVSKFIGKSNFKTVPPVLADYWSTIEFHFHEVLRDYTVESDSEAIRCQWLKHVRGALKNAWEQHRASVSMGDAWSIRALVKAEGPVLRKLKELNDEILKLEPQEESA
jgi:CRISPR system Cascade subunit CasA